MATLPPTIGLSNESAHEVAKIWAYYYEQLRDDLADRLKRRGLGTAWGGIESDAAKRALLKDILIQLDEIRGQLHTITPKLAARLEARLSAKVNASTRAWIMKARRPVMFRVSFDSVIAPQLNYVKRGSLLRRHLISVLDSRAVPPPIHHRLITQTERTLAESIFNPKGNYVDAITRVEREVFGVNYLTGHKHPALPDPVTEVIPDEAYGLRPGFQPPTSPKGILPDVKRLVRTEMSYAHHGERLAAAQADPFAVGVKVLISNIACELCQEELGGSPGEVVEFAFDEVPDIPVHPNCVIGDTLLEARSVEAVLRRPYRGEIMTIHAENRQLTVTANHPALTLRGMVPARRIRPGDYMVGASRGVECFADPYNQHVISTAEKFFDSFSVACGVTTECVPMSAEDFHGDGTNGEVAVVLSDGLLRHNRDSARPQFGGDFSLVNRIMQAFSFARLSAFYQFIFTTLFPAYSVMSGSGHGGALLLRGACVPDLLRFVHAARSDTQCDEASSDNVSADGILGGARELRHPGTVVAPEVIERNLAAGMFHRYRVDRVDVQFFDGHVFNLQTASGLYNSNALVSSNCFCGIAGEKFMTMDEAIDAGLISA